MIVVIALITILILISYFIWKKIKKNHIFFSKGPLLLMELRNNYSICRFTRK